MTKSAFRKSAIIWLLCLAGVILAGPATMAVLVLSGQCGNPQGLCFAVTLMFLFFVGPIAAVALSLLLLWSIGRRTKFLGMGALWTAAVAVWLVAFAPHAALIIGLGGLGVIGSIGRSPGGAQFAEMLINLPTTPIPFLLAFAAFLVRAEPMDIRLDDAKRRAALMIAAVVAAHLTVLFFGSAVEAISRIPFYDFHSRLRSAATAASNLYSMATFGAPYRIVPLIFWIDFAIFSTALAYVVTFQGDEASSSGTSSVVQRAGRPLPSSPPRASFGRRQG